MQSIPNHVAIIPDGNRRWAKAHGLPTLEGHRRGFEMAKKIARKARELGVRVLTFWAFSTENWNRSPEEVGYLMKLYEKLIDDNLKEAIKDQVRLIHIGRVDRLPERLLIKLHNALDKTKDFTKHYLVIALDYGGHDEVLRAVSRLLRAGVDTITERDIYQNLDTRDLPYPDVDLIIRTSGEMRTSGYLIWQAAYAEYMFTKKHFPEFTPEDFEACIEEYGQRQRRFGK